IVGDIQIPDHPLVNEVMKDTLFEAMDLEGLKQVLRGIEQGSIQTLAVDTPVPSQFSHEILNSNPYAYLDDAPLEERRARAVQMRQLLPASVLEEVGKLDEAAIVQVREEAWPDVRDADELHDALLTMIAIPESTAVPGAEEGADGLTIAQAWDKYFERLHADGRAAVACEGEIRFWVAAEKASVFSLVYPAARFETSLRQMDGTVPATRSDAVLAMINGWMMHSGPMSAADLARRLGLAAADVNNALLRLEATGTILRGKYTSTAAGIEEWCERRLLARIHRLTVGRLRKEIEPVTPAQFMRWLPRWQHVAGGSQVSGERGLLEVLRQLQGFEIPANAWERQVLARRVNDYDPKALDQLCLTGAVGWGRLSPHPATLEGAESADGKRTRRVIPTSVAPITFFLREEAEWMPHRPPQQEDHRELSHGARQVLDFLRQRGASFFADIVRGTGKLKSEIETALWELVAAGLVTADGFDNLRSLIDPKRRSGHGSGRSARPRHSTGRWSVLHPVDLGDRTRGIEATCWMLLRRYGVVFRELLARETMMPKWRELVMAFRRLEDRGEIRGGRFVTGFLGEQFALPVAVESLRATRKQEPAGETVAISAADPLNLVGIIVPGERVPAISGRYVTFRDGVAVSEEAPRMMERAVGD
ncbi:MAG TPA: hypothetical protein VK473_14225, partial [Terriglobales bacterium]|nr:hypothetical protein [Terriglobales bacterium]